MAGPWPLGPANGKAQFKWRSYKGVLARQEAGGPRWLTKSTMKQTDVFVPFAFEVGGAMGDESEDFRQKSSRPGCERRYARHVDDRTRTLFLYRSTIFS